ncbi:MAG: chemotaxis protein CheD, partial [Rhodobacteraceae bacterium]|nr:chemotaxis protein CheD [Paracoccaceae bacterium]
MKLGGSRESMTAKVFGGANITGAFGDIGLRNADFAVRYLKTEGIEISAIDVGGTHARRVLFHPTTGVARMSKVRMPPVETKQPASAASPAVELF